MTIVEVPGSENEYSRTKNRLPENLGTPVDAAVVVFAVEYSRISATILSCTLELKRHSQKYKEQLL